MQAHDNGFDVIAVHLCFVLIATSDYLSYKNSHVILHASRTNLRVNKLEEPDTSSCNTIVKTRAHNEKEFLCSPKMPLLIKTGITVAYIMSLIHWKTGAVYIV
jgi:hypothetical protein